MKSMTGFGRGHVETQDFLCHVEIKSVNSRYFDLSIKAPRQCNVFEERIRAIVGNIIKRGKAELFIRITEKESSKTTPKINESLVNVVRNFLVEKGFYKKKKDIPVELIASIAPNWITLEEKEIDGELLKESIEIALQDALNQLNSMRLVEGSYLIKDIEKRLETLIFFLKGIEEKKESAVKHHENRLREKMLSILENEAIRVNEDRLVQEIAILADKTDITEEIVRFKSHMVQLQNTLQENEVKGRKLDFLIQELNREVNTMGSKTSDAEITGLVVNLKCELEKIREQVQNME